MRELIRILTAATLLCAAAETSLAAGPQIPSLAWTPLSDWVDVKGAGAKGDGVADDAPAIQRVLDEARSGSTIYLPPGTYRITAPLRLTGPLVGVSVLGHGRDTTLRWDGPPGGMIFADDGVAYSRYVGLQFDGAGKAAAGFHHDSHQRFETEVRHEHLAFRNFTDAGVLVEPKDKYTLAETLFENCLFEDCERGVVFVSFNDYNYTFDGCEFLRCRIALECRHGNFYARNCHFEASREVDIYAAAEHACSIRRCTSLGSAAFLHHRASVAPTTIQDCHVAGWTSPQGAVLIAGAPVMMFDCVFTGGPGGRAPVKIARDRQVLIMSENRPAAEAGLIQPGHTARLYSIPAGRHRGSIASARQRFLKDRARVPSRVFDAKRDFGARGDGRADDTAAIQKAIDAARRHGDGALAYLPTGKYVITDTLQITGRDYTVGGSGFLTHLVWKGAEGGTMVGVFDPRDVTLAHLSVGTHDVGAMNNGIDVLQTGSEVPSRVTYDGLFVYGMYQKKPLRKGLHLRGLSDKAVVVMAHLQGNLRIIDCGRATILARCSYEGSVVVEGADRRREGILAFQTRLSTATTHGLYLKDNHNIVMTDFYTEQADGGFVFVGSPGDPPGRATIQGAKVDFTRGKDNRDGTVMEIRGYGGEIFFGPNQFYASLPRVPLVHTGDAKLDVFLIGNCFYKTPLVVEKGPAMDLHLVGNHSVAVEAGDTVRGHEARAVDNVTARGLARIAWALDDLRRVGELDLKFNHGE